MKGLEPPHISMPEPKSGASANFATSALFGSPTWARTTDQQINSLLLYRLSYWGINLTGVLSEQMPPVLLVHQSWLF